MTQLTTASAGETQAVAAKAVHERWPDTQANAVHEQIVEHRLGEVIELQLHAEGGCPHRKAATHDDCGRHHAKTITGDRLPPDPDRKPHRYEQQDVRIRRQILKETLHLRDP